MATVREKLVRLTYNCDPESLRDIPQDDFVDALENEFMTWFPIADLSVTFKAGKSEVFSVAMIANADFVIREHDTLEETMRELSERAIKACCIS